MLILGSGPPSFQSKALELQGPRENERFDASVSSHKLYIDQDEEF